MNTVTIKGDIYHKYFDDKAFCKSAALQSLEYIKRYRETGEVAFYSVIVAADDNSSHQIVFLANRYPTKDEDSGTSYSILVAMPLYMKQSEHQTIGVVLNYDVSIKDNAFDVYIDFPDGDDMKEINQEVIDDLGDNLNDWPEEIIDKLQAKTVPIICLFARVQMSALKTSRKIQKAIRRAQSKPMKFQPLDAPQKPNVIRLDEKMTLTIDISDGADSKREFIRHCEAWMVRGHYRHYKSGKVVYISPYKKGKGKLNDKIYEATKE